MSIMYLVSKGCYSDYSVLGIYSTKEKAKLAAKLYSDSWDEAQVEEYELDVIPEHPPGKLFWSVVMNKDGDTFGSRFRGNKEGVQREAADRSEWRTKEDRWVEPYSADQDGWVVFYVWAEDETTAIKVANERRAFLVANNEFPDDYRAWYKKTTGKDYWR